MRKLKEHLSRLGLASSDAFEILPSRPAHKDRTK